MRQLFHLTQRIFVFSVDILTPSPNHFRVPIKSFKCANQKTCITTAKREIKKRQNKESQQMFGWGFKGAVFHTNSLTKNDTAHFPFSLSSRDLQRGQQTVLTMTSARNVTFVWGGHKVKSLCLFFSKPLIKSRSPWGAGSAGTDCFSSVLNCLLIFLQSKQNGRFKEYA